MTGHKSTDLHTDDVAGVCFFTDALAGVSDEYINAMTPNDVAAWTMSMWSTPILVATVEELVDGEWDKINALTGE